MTFIDRDLPTEEPRKDPSATRPMSVLEMFQQLALELHGYDVTVAGKDTELI
jgi:hypothetical protein